MEEEKFSERAAISLDNAQEAARVDETVCAIPQLPDATSASSTPAATSRDATLLSVLESVSAGVDSWPQQAYLAALERYGRMPRKGWTRAQQYFCSKFSVAMTVEDFTGKAKKALVTETGRKCPARNFQDSAIKRRKTVLQLFEENTLRETQLSLKMLTMLRTHIRKMESSSIEEAVRTRKVSTQMIRPDILAALNYAVGQYAAENTPKTMEGIARILQAAQTVYQEAATPKPKEASGWAQSIERKIDAQKAAKSVLLKAKAKETLSGEERTLARKAMREQSLVLSKPHDIDEAVATLDNIIHAHEKRLNMHEKRKEYRKQNMQFELNRRRFYRDLTGGQTMEHDVPTEEVKRFWSTMWNRPEAEAGTEILGRWISEYDPGRDPPTVFPDRKEFGEIINRLPPWKAAGIDRVFNYFIKNITELHNYLYEVIRGICLQGDQPGDWFYKGIVYLIPKGTPMRGSDFRPIACMSCLYKLTTKCVTEVVKLEAERRGLLAENQLGAVRGVQGAKEQALLNIAVNKAHANRLKMMWIDVKKAFDSINHGYLLACLKALRLPTWVQQFLESTIARWALQVCSNQEIILEKRMERGILQGDTLSPLLFALCMDPLSRALNGKFPKVEVEAGEGRTHSVNHLLFIDDLKLFGCSESDLKLLAAETYAFFDSVGLEPNKEKSATNSPICAGKAELLEGAAGYKYLGITEDSTGVPKRSCFESIRTELMARINRLCETKLNARNLIHSVNEHALSLLNYYVGVLRLEPKDFEDLDHAVRQSLMRHGVHNQLGCLERLYLPRNQLGRGLHSAVFRSELMLAQLLNTLTAGAPCSTRRACIAKVEEAAKTHMALISSYLSAKYGTEPTLDPAVIRLIQQKSLYGDINKKVAHKKLYRAAENEMVSMQGSSLWLRSGNIAPREEAALCALQDRNLFMGAEGVCQHCGKAARTVDHLASRCEKMLAHDYTRRHNEVVRCLHLLLCNRYGLKSSKKIRLHSVQEIVSNRDVEIRVDTRVKTDIKVAHDRPDIFVLDKRNKLATLIEVGITSQDQLKTVETEKCHKYDLLAGEVTQMYQCRAKIIPYVMTWDGVVTKCHKKYIAELGIPPNVEAYIQSRVLRRTLETVRFEARRGILENGDGMRPEVAIVELMSNGAQVAEDTTS